MLKKVLRYTARILLILSLLLVIALSAIAWYAYSNRKDFIERAAGAAGFEIDYRDAYVSDWADWPALRLRFDSLSVRQKGRPDTLPDLLLFDTLDVAVSFDKIMDDTLELTHLYAADGSIHYHQDSTGNPGKDRYEPPVDKPVHSPLKPYLAWDGAAIDLRRINTLYRRPGRKKEKGGFINHIRGNAYRSELDRRVLRGTLDIDVEGLSFNTDVGSYLSNAKVKGPFELANYQDSIILKPTRLQIGEQTFNVDLMLATAGSLRGRLRVAHPAADYQQSRALLNDKLHKKLGEYEVDGPFPVRAEIKIMEPGIDPLVNIWFALNNQGVRTLTYQYRNASLQGHFINRLPGVPDEDAHPKHFVFTLDSVTATYGPLDFVTEQARVIGDKKDVRLETVVSGGGRAADLARYLGNTDYFFDGGTFATEIRTKATLLYIDRFIAETDGRIVFRDADVRYAPTGTRLPLDTIDLRKVGEDISVYINSRPLPDGTSFALAGQLDNLTPLLLDRPADSVRATVAITSEDLHWETITGLFGGQTGGTSAGDTSAGDTSAGGAAGEGGMTLNGSNGLKQTLLGFRDRFHPNIALAIDRFSYYDRLQLSDLNAALSFVGDSLVLGDTHFDMVGADMNFAAALDLSRGRNTPFRVLAAADRLDLERLRPALAGFGLQLPAEITQLPSNLDIDLSHRGLIDDAFGPLPDRNTGRLVFTDGYRRRFTGRLDYHPTAEGQYAKLLLQGDPSVIDGLFDDAAR